jgi:hypothetical protein
MWYLPRFTLVIDGSGRRWLELVEIGRHIEREPQRRWGAIMRE